MSWWWTTPWAIAFQLFWVSAASSSGSSNSWNQVQFSRVGDDASAAPFFPNTETVSTAPHALVDHHQPHDQRNWLQRALSHRIWKPAQFLVPPSLRRPEHGNKQQHPPKEKGKHVEGSNNHDSNRKQASNQPDIRQPPVSSSSSSVLEDSDTPEEIANDFTPPIATTLSPSPPWASTVVAALAPWLNGRRIITGIQVGLIAFVLREVWKAAQEVLEEYSAEFSGIGDGSPSSVGGALKSDAVERIIQAVEMIQQQRHQKMEEEEKMQRRRNTQRPAERMENQMLQNHLPPTLLPYVQLAQNLIAAGLPLRRSHNMGHASSVEHVLRSATRTELALLQQCLWTPPLSSASSRPHWNHGGINHDLLSSSLLSPFSQVAGLDSVKQRLLDLLLLLQQRQRSQLSNVDDNHLTATLDDYSHLLFPSESHGAASASTSSSSSSTSGPIRAGILLYGPPGCGKTLLVKTLASTAHMPCLVVSPSTLLRKFVGDSNQQVRSLFTLASKLGNCIICIDELDGLFRQRHDQEHDVTRDLKTEFLQWWDGMMMTSMQGNANHDQPNSNDSRRPLLVVIGATNRPFDVDPAVLRRLPQSHYIGLPSTSDRLELLHQLIYRNKKTPPPRRPGSSSPVPNRIPEKQDLDLVQLAMVTQGYTPSDIQQLLQTAVTMGPLRRMQEAVATPSRPASDGDQEHSTPQQLKTQDVLNAMEHVRPTPLSASYQRALERFVQGNHHSSSGSSSSSNFSETSKPSTSERLASASKWETVWGNFYHVGTLEMDMPSWNAFQQILFQFDDEDDEELDDRNQDHAPFHDESYPPQHGRDNGNNDEDNDDEEDETDDL